MVSMNKIKTWVRRLKFYLKHDFLTVENIVLMLAIILCLVWTYQSIAAMSRNWELSEKLAGERKELELVSVEVETAEELALVAYLVNKGINNFNNVTIKLIKNIDLSGKYWVPIGFDTNHSFKGTFDGNGYSIKYATVNKNSLDDSATSQYIENILLSFDL